MKKKTFKIDNYSKVMGQCQKINSDVGDFMDDIYDIMNASASTGKDDEIIQWNKDAKRHLKKLKKNLTHTEKIIARLIKEVTKNDL